MRAARWQKLLLASLSCPWLLALPVPAQSSAVSSRSGPAQIAAAAREQWTRDLHDKKTDAAVAQYAADAEFLQPDGSRLRGAAAIRNLYQTIVATYDSDLVFESQRVEGCGDLIYDSGTFHESLIFRANGKPQLSTGSYLTIYRRNSSGTWHIVEQAWTGSAQ